MSFSCGIIGFFFFLQFIVFQYYICFNEFLLLERFVSKRYGIRKVLVSGYVFLFRIEYVGQGFRGYVFGFLLMICSFLGVETSLEVLVGCLGYLFYFSSYLGIGDRFCQCGYFGKKVDVCFFEGNVSQVRCVLCCLLLFFLVLCFKI